MLWLLSGCVLFNDIERVDCINTRECQDTFGSTYTCETEGDSAGYCSEITLHPRCTTTPEDLFTAPLNEDGSNPYENTYIIGQMFNSEQDRGKIEAANLAFNDIVSTQANGKWLDDMRIARVACDYMTQGSEDANLITEELTNYLAQTVGAAIIIGPSTSSKTNIAFKTANTITPSSLFISPSATADILKTQDGTAHTQEDPGIFWRTTGPDQFQANILHWMVTNEGSVTDVAVLYEEDIYGEGLFTQLKTIFNASDVTVHSKILQNDTEDAVRIAINSAMNESPDITAVIFISSTAPDIVEAIDTMGTYPDTPLILTDSAVKDEVRDAVITFSGGNSTLQERIIAQVSGTQPAIPDTPLFDIFKGRYPGAETNVFAAHTYDAMWLGAVAIGWAHYNGNPYNPSDLGRGIRSIADTTSMTELDLTDASWPQIRTQLEAGNTINLMGTSSELDFDPISEELQTGISIWRFGTDLGSFEVEQTCYEANCADLSSGE